MKEAKKQFLFRVAIRAVGGGVACYIGVSHLLIFKLAFPPRVINDVGPAEENTFFAQDVSAVRFQSFSATNM